MIITYDFFSDFFIWWAAVDHWLTLFNVQTGRRRCGELRFWQKDANNVKRLIDGPKLIESTSNGALAVNFLQKKTSEAAEKPKNGEFS